jgi:hypothetical protein
LRSEPFLIAGAVAIAEAQPARAERLFVEAKRRDPRSAAARYFLAQQYFSTGRPVLGLEEASVLTRLVSGAGTALVPGLAQYARAPGAIPNLRHIFAGNPDLRDGVLTALASDADNASLLMALAGRDDSRGRTEAPPEWQAVLLKSMVARGDFTKARALWSHLSKVRADRTGLFNPRFAKIAAPAPFNWSLQSGDFGVAEATATGGLQIIYYGRTDAEFASQLLLLAPGSYDLRMRVMRDAQPDQSSGLAWTLTCQPTSQHLLALPFTGSGGAEQRWSGRFTVPANCPGVLLALRGTAHEFAQSEQATVDQLQLIGPASR